MWRHKKYDFYPTFRGLLFHFYLILLSYTYFNDVTHDTFRCPKLQHTVRVKVNYGIASLQYKHTLGSKTNFIAGSLVQDTVDLRYHPFLVIQAWDQGDFLTIQKVMDIFILGSYNRFSDYLIKWNSQQAKITIPPIYPFTPSPPLLRMHELTNVYNLNWRFLDIHVYSTSIQKL